MPVIDGHPWSNRQRHEFTPRCRVCIHAIVVSVHFTSVVPYGFSLIRDFGQAMGSVDFPRVAEQDHLCALQHS
jgi:hypothetical protein